MFCPNKLPETDLLCSNR